MTKIKFVRNAFKFIGLVLYKIIQFIVLLLFLPIWLLVTTWHWMQSENSFKEEMVEQLNKMLK